MPYRIVSRAEAGLKPPTRQPAKMRLPVRELWLHHTVTPVTNDPMADWRQVQAIAFGRGFVDISYSYGVHPTGVILEGRGDRVGAHTAGRNSTSYGVVLIGNYENQVPPEIQIDAVRWLIKALKDRGGLPMQTFPSGGHRDLMATACPGRHAYIRIADMRRAWVAPGPTATPTREGAVVINRPPIAMLTHPTWPAKSYIIISDDGGVFNFGGAPFYGSLGGIHLNAPVIEAGVTESGQGYWMLGRDGGVFTFGDAPAYHESGRVEYSGT